MQRHLFTFSNVLFTVPGVGSPVRVQRSLQETKKNEPAKKCNCEFCDYVCKMLEAYKNENIGG